MEDFKLTREYRKIGTTKSFKDWNKMTSILTTWKVLLPETLPLLGRLKTLRHEYAAHFNPETDTRDRELALEAIKLFQEFIQIQFGAMGLQPWFILGTAGAAFIKKSYESDPFVKRIYLPSCVLVGPRYKFVSTPTGFAVEDEVYEDKEISDEQFKILLDETR